VVGRFCVQGRLSLPCVYHTTYKQLNL
jgi:hypothetical protein